MRLKLFRAATMAEAMASVRNELGAEALILSTRRISGGVEITAALDRADSPALDEAPIHEMPFMHAPAATPAAEQAPHGPVQNGPVQHRPVQHGPVQHGPVQHGPIPHGPARRDSAPLRGPRPIEPPASARSDAPRLHAERVGAGLPDERREAAFAFHGVPEPIGRRLMAGPLAFALSAAFRFTPAPLAVDAPPLLFAGPPGAGKTLTVARLASRLVMRGLTPLVITADGKRAGATEQLAAFTRLLGIDLIVACTPAMVTRALARRVDGAPVLIDGPGTDAFDPGQQEEIRLLATTAGATMALVLPAGLDPVEAADIAASHRQNAASLLIANRLDGARRLGGILAAAAAGLAMTEAGTGPGAADGLVPMTPEFLAARLMQLPDRHA
jgi:flagellar biosynthesis protein FlhF